jgi:Xaa-Pro aminopeptidase
MAAMKRISRLRLQQFRRALADKHVTAALVTDGADVRYLSGFTGDDSWLLVGPRRAALLTDSRYAEQAEAECPGISVVVRRGPMIEALAGAVGRARIRRLGFDPEKVSVAVRSRLLKALRGVRLVQAGGIARRLRITKDPSEVRAICRAIRAAEEAWRGFRKAVRPGMTEQRLAAELDHRMRLAGAEGPAFPTICAVDASASMPHARPGSRRLKRGSVLLVDFGARVGGYVSDLTRCLFLGRIRPRVRAVYQAVLEAQSAAISAVGPGVGLAEVDAAARGVLEAAGFGKAFGHGTGHGIGLEIHEPPALSPQAAKGRLEPGMVVTIEPGVYLRGRFGIRIEDNVLITERGRHVLTSLEKDLEAMVV